MKVRELIAILQNIDPESLVVIKGDSVVLSYIEVQNARIAAIRPANWSNTGEHIEAHETHSDCQPAVILH